MCPSLPHPRHPPPLWTPSTVYSAVRPPVLKTDRRPFLTCAAPTPITERLEPSFSVPTTLSTLPQDPRLYLLSLTPHTRSTLPTLGTVSTRPTPVTRVVCTTPSLSGFQGEITRYQGQCEDQTHNPSPGYPNRHDPCCRSRTSRPKFLLHRSTIYCPDTVKHTLPSHSRVSV